MDEKKHINIIGVIGVILFNLILGLALSITVLALLLSLWIITASFIAAPAIFGILIIMHLQVFTWWQFLLSLFLIVVGIILYPISKKLSVALFDFFKKYIKYNQKVVHA
ncbi:XRE family transcriptional regulator [Holzapfeliella sp. JNUCC 80]